MAVSDWSTTPAENATKPGINWAEGMPPSAVNNSARQMMADIRAGTRLSVPNIAAMTAILKASLSDGDQVTVSGYSAAGDGGGGTFYWDDGSVAPPDGGTIFEADEGGAGRWRRVVSGAVDVRWFNPNTSADNTAAVQAAQAVGEFVYYGKYYRVDDDDARRRMYLGDVSIPTPTDRRGNDTVRFNFPYTFISEADGVIDQTTWDSPIKPVMIEQGDYIVFKIRFKGFFNEIRFEWRESATFRSQLVTAISPPIPADDRIKNSSDGNNLEKQVIIYVNKTQGDYALDDGVIDGVRLRFNTNSGDQDAQFDIIEVKYTWHNNKNTVVVPAQLPLGWRGIAARNADDGANSDTTLPFSSDEAAGWFRRNVDDYIDLGIDWIAINLQYKHVYNNGATRHDYVARLVDTLNYLAVRGINVYLILNTGYSVNQSFDPPQWVRVEDVDSEAKRQTMAERARDMLKLVVDHKAIKAVMLENELNTFLLGRQHDSIVTSNFPAEDLVDYVQRLAAECRKVTTKPLSVAYSGGLHASMLWTNEIFDHVDFISISMYSDAQFGRLLPYTDKPILSGESEGDNFGSRFFEWSESRGVWFSFVNPYYTSSFDQNHIDTFRQTFPKAVKDMGGAFRSLLAVGANALGHFDPMGGDVVWSVTDARQFWRYDPAGDAWVEYPAPPP